MPVALRPVLHWTLDEAADAGLLRAIIITNPHKPMLEAVARNYQGPLELDPAGREGRVARHVRGRHRTPEIDEVLVLTRRGADGMGIDTMAMDLGLVAAYAVVVVSLSYVLLDLIWKD